MDNRQNQTNINWYPGHMAKTKRLLKEQIRLVDVVYEVIDSRIPHSSKVVDLENYILDKPKIIILTKYDLCDKSETEKWIEHYRLNGCEVIAVDLLHLNVKQILKKTEEIMTDINIKRQQKGMNKKRTRIAVVGIPNVGKSTLINCLIGKKSVKVGNRPGITKNLNWIRINEKIELLDTPGILWPKFEEEVAFNLASFTAIKEEILPIDQVAYYILKKLYNYYPKILEERYGISELDDDFFATLEKIGKKRGCIKKGGVVDEDRVYREIITDMKEGYIRGVTFDRYN